MKFENIIRNPENIVKKLKSEKNISIYPKYDIILSCILSEFQNENVVILVDSKRTANNLKLLLGDALINPEFGLYPYEIDFVERGVIHAKIEFLKKFYSLNRKIVVTTLKGLFDPILPENSIKELRIRKGQKLPMRDLFEMLIFFGYRREKEIQEKGDFSAKGSIIDIFTFSYDNPVRMFYGFEEEIEDIKFFSAENFRSFEEIDEITINPDTYYLFDESTMKKLEKSVENELTVSKNEYLIDSVLEDLKEVRTREKYGMNFYFKYLKKGEIFSFPTLLDKTKDFIKIYVEPMDFESFFKEASEYYDNAFSANEILFEDIENIKKAFTKFNDGKIITLRGVPGENTIEVPVSQIPENFAFLTSIKDYVLSTLSEKNVIFLTTQGERVEEILKLYEIPFSRKLKKEKGVYVIEGFSSAGIEGETSVVLSDKELFIHFEPEKKIPKFMASKGITSYEELTNGDLVVHKDFGIGIFRGLTKLENYGTKEYLLIEYRDGEKLYVPLERIGFVEKYIGDKRLITLNRLSGNEWKNTKEKATESARILARKLLVTQAERKLKGGYSFKPYPRDEQVLALSFPYELTEDQQKALEEVYEDMESNNPMDRIICGDVGYGKTEIAVRAAFRAVLNGKQAAILVPTTILALQHERTFQERLRFFPIEVSSLSRLNDAKSEKEILRRMKEGKTDIIIGTHRILSKDVEFKDLGILIIDEEQKFGVKHKEKIKELKATIDILTLTATPIPRTLHSALLNLKPVSLIATAPPGRIPVKTYVLPFNVEIMKNAIEYELKRDGQVFIVYNRIEDIFIFAKKIQDLIPQATVAVAHGKMKKENIEDIMLQFYEGNINVLVSTTIIENGLDIPTVNTLIVNGAENFGLAQMYQLRGRIGRSHINAFAYFFYTEKTALKSIAEERLETIKEFSGSGAGIKIAMKDLEIRGAGNLLGKEQHGHMVSVGYNMYVTLIEKAVSELKGEHEQIESEVRVSLKENYYIPESYMELNAERIAFYRKITSIRNAEEIKRIREELEDRFGEVPKEVENLLNVGLIMRLSKDLGINEVFQEGRRVFLSINETNYITSKGIEKIVQDESVKFGKDYISFEVKNNPLKETLKVLNLLNEGQYAKMDN